MGELTKLSNAGKQSPGPIYQYNEAVKYQNVSWGWNNDDYRNLPGDSEHLRGLETTEQSTISMKTQLSLMIHWLLIFQEKLGPKLQKLELSLE